MHRWQSNCSIYEVKYSGLATSGMCKMVQIFGGVGRFNAPNQALHFDKQKLHVTMVVICARAGSIFLLFTVNIGSLPVCYDSTSTPLAVEE